MNIEMQRLMAETIREFHLPRYGELPNMGLYLEQVVKYVNTCLSPLGCLEVTPSMVSNYVKKGLIAKPVKKQYYADHIAYLIFIILAKNLMSIENINLLIDIQKRSYASGIAYDYLCNELENILQCLFEVKDTLDEMGDTQSVEKDVLRNLVFSAAHMIYINACLKQFHDSNIPKETN